MTVSCLSAVAGAKLELVMSPGEKGGLVRHASTPLWIRPCSTVSEFVQWHWKIDKCHENICPVTQPARRIPFHMRKQVEDELNNLEQQGIIEKVEGPTPWVSPLVIIPKKNGGVRVCVDMRMANAAIKRE